MRFVVCVCGGRRYNNQLRVFETLDALHAERTITAVVHGAAPGADSLAERWAKSRFVDYIGCPADWDRHGNAAGPIRNTRMLDTWLPDLVVSFPGGTGTADCVKKAGMRSINAKEIGA